MYSAGFEPAIPATKRLQTYALHRAATGNGREVIHSSEMLVTTYKPTLHHKAEDHNQHPHLSEDLTLDKSIFVLIFN
jgi:hypothetical protein